ncbi:Tetratricopeptide repeat-containing protein [Thiocapsa roseopersicina]|uniref:Tetratricopeptide repeat-containing protein n=2 Tax=Thiocapsa roseopersicina TaxID=1058 RepID=A0A1H3DRY1_THIRO|nr:Tetratricopeptide repeat-containing protein [Thiocapsa roseopersicina]
MVSTELVEAMLNEDETRFQNGISELLSLSRMDDVPALALLELGYFLLLRGLAAMAIPYLEQAAALSPRNRDIWTLKCLGHVRLGQRQQAIDSMAVAVDIESFPEDINLLEALQAGEASIESQAASVLFHPSLSLFDDSSEANFHNRIYRFALHQIERTDSNNVEIISELAKCYYRLNELERAEGYAKRALASKPCCSECLTLLGLIETNRKRDKDAIEYYRQAVECDGQALLARINLASAIQSEGGWSESRSLLEKALQLVQNKEEKGALNESEREWACIGLDLLASNVGVSEHDVVRELALREQALEVGCSKTPAFIANFALCLFFNAKFERFLRYTSYRHKLAFLECLEFQRE